MKEDDYLPPEECLAADERPVEKRTRYITDFELSYAPYDDPNDYTENKNGNQFSFTK